MMKKKTLIIVFSFWLFLFLINFGHGAGWAGVYSILIKKVGSEKLSDFFLYSALSGLVINIALIFFSDIMTNSRLIKISFFIFILLLSGNLILLDFEQSLPEKTFQMGLIFISVLIIAVPSVFIIQTWDFINKTFSIQNATKYYPILSTAPLIGNIIGGATASYIPRHHETKMLIYVWIACILTAFFELFFLNKTIQNANNQCKTEALNQKTLIDNFKEGFNFFKKSSFAIHLGIVFMSFWFVCTIVDFCYAKTLEKVYDTSQEMASFYGSYTTIVNSFALCIQLFLGSTLIKKIGIRKGFLFLPLSQILGFIFFLFSSGLTPIVTIMFAETLIGMTIQSNSVQMSFNIFPKEVRGKVRTLLEGIINPLGGVFASLSISFAVYLQSKGLFSSEYIFPLIGLIFASIWLYSAIQIKKSYLLEVKKTLLSSDEEDIKNAQEALSLEKMA